MEPITVYDLWNQSATQVGDPEQPLSTQSNLKARRKALEVEEGSVETALDRLELEVAQRVAAEKIKEAQAQFIHQLGVNADKGDPVALEVLYYTACEAVAALSAHGTHDPDSLRRFARKQTLWPVLLWSDFISNPQSLKGYKDLRLGSEVDAPVDLHSLHRRKSTSTPVSSWVKRFALEVHDVRCAFGNRFLPNEEGRTEGLVVTLPSDFCVTVDDVPECLRLPALTADEEAQRAWFDLAEKVAAREAGGDLTKHRKFRALGEQQANNHPRAYRNGCKESGKRRPKTSKCIARDTIEKAMKTTLKSLARKLHKPLALRCKMPESKVLPEQLLGVPESHLQPMTETLGCSHPRLMTPAVTTGETKPLPRAAKSRQKLRKSRSPRP